MYHLTVFEFLTQVVTDLRQRLVTVLFETLARAVDHFEPVVDMLLYLWSHVSVSHLDTVDLCLVLEKLLYGNLLRDHTVRIAIPFHAFHRSLHTECLNVGLQDGLVANDPDDLVDDGTHVDGVAVGGDAISREPGSSGDSR